MGIITKYLYSLYKRNIKDERHPTKEEKETSGIRTDNKQQRIIVEEKVAKKAEYLYEKSMSVEELLSKTIPIQSTAATEVLYKEECNPLQVDVKVDNASNPLAGDDTSISSPIVKGTTKEEKSQDESIPQDSNSETESPSERSISVEGLLSNSKEVTYLDPIVSKEDLQVKADSIPLKVAEKTMIANSDILEGDDKSISSPIVEKSKRKVKSGEKRIRDASLQVEPLSIKDKENFAPIDTWSMEEYILPEVVESPLR